MHAPTAIKTLVAICKDEHAPQAARVSASQAILDRGYGRPATFSTGDTTQFKRAIDMTDDELAAIVAGARSLPCRMEILSPLFSVSICTLI